VEISSVRAPVGQYTNAYSLFEQGDSHFRKSGKLIT
jgi:hypothetical protein